MTQLTYLGHACFLIETKEAGCLIDPWLTPKGAFLGAWRQLPPNDHMLPWLIAKMQEKPFLIYVTHEHEDHFDEETLSKILPYAKKLCIPNYERGYFKSRISSQLCYKPELIDENVEQSFFDINFKIFIDESGINRDSAIFVKTKDLAFFDANDCKIFDRAYWLKEQCGSIDILSSQFSGANMHPICYDIPEEEYKKISRQKKMRKFLAARNFINDLRPKYYIPSAGPAIFPYPEHYHLNFETETIFPKWWEFDAYLKDKKIETELIALDVGGSSFRNEGGELVFQAAAMPLDEAKLNEIIDYYRKFDKENVTPNKFSEAEVIHHFEKEMSDKVSVLKAHPSVPLSCDVYFSIKGEHGSDYTYVIEASAPDLKRVGLHNFKQPYYLHQTSIASLRKLVESTRGWGAYFLSFLFRNKRDPDVFDSVLSTFFVANDTDELEYGLKKLALFRDNNEQISLMSPDGLSSVVCKRYCPHQGADLKYAQFDGKYVICPRHQWRFDCENGGKADNSADTINAQIFSKGEKSNVN